MQREQLSVSSKGVAYLVSLPKKLSAYPFIRNLLSACFISLTVLSCGKPGPYIADFMYVGSYVIGREWCKNNEADEYWIVDLSYYPDTPQYGDTLTLNGVTYKNVVKVKGLDPAYMQIGMKVSFDFRIITPNKVMTTGCTLINPVTYNLKELIFISQHEIR